MALTVERTGALPLSFAQEQLWFLDRLQPGSAAYNVALALRMDGALDVAALQRALREIVRRHEVLRTTFDVVDGAPVQVIAPLGSFMLTVEDLSALGATERDAAVKARVQDDAMRQFDLAAGPLFRAALLRLNGEEHVLMLGWHHVISDGLSRGVLFRELDALYGAYHRGGESPLPELPVQYADYALWQRADLQGDLLRRELAYWRAQLAGAPALLALPTDRPRPPVQTYRGARERMVLPPELLAQLKMAGRREGATLFMVLLAAFQMLLSRYSGSEDVVVGSPFAGRARKELEDLIGLFVNTLVLRTDLSGNPAFCEVLRRVRTVTLGAYDHQTLPFEKLVAELQPERSLSYSPLYQVVFSLFPGDGSGPPLDGVSVQRLDVAAESTRFDLELGFTVESRGLSAVLTYSTDLFDQSTIARILAHLALLLQRVASDPDVRLRDVDLLTEAERRMVVSDWSQTPALSSADGCIHQLVEAQAARTPEAAAVLGPRERVSYRELNERATRLAHALQTARGAVIGVALRRTSWLVTSLLAILKAGAAYLPLDPSLPPARLRLLLEDAGVSQVLTDDETADTMIACGARAIDVAALASREPPAGAMPLDAAGPDDLAYVLYTSGSTGLPKGVAVPHRALTNIVTDMSTRVSVTPASRLFAVSNITFDIAGLEIWMPLTVGASCWIASTPLSAGAVALRELAESDCSIMQTTPSGWRALLESGWRGDGRMTALCGGEALPAPLARELLRHCAAVWNLYGPTETTIWSTAHRVRSDDDPVPIGRPVSGTQVYVLGARLEPVPIGAIGELCIGGEGVAMGYRGRPAQTAEAFRPDPFSGPGRRLYKTGDLTRYRSDGVLQFIGRRDSQVKVRGFRIELGEIEAALAAQPGIRHAVVTTTEDRPGDVRLVAYVVPDGELPDDGCARSEALRRSLRERLPAYMLPNVIVWIAALPLTPNGKVDRKRLPAPEPEPHQPSEQLRTAAERQLHAIWSDVLGHSNIGRGDNFFALGGHSMSAMQMMFKAGREFGAEIPLHVVFERPVLAELAEYLVSQTR